MNEFKNSEKLTKCLNAQLYENKFIIHRDLVIRLNYMNPGLLLLWLKKQIIPMWESMEIKKTSNLIIMKGLEETMSHLTKQTIPWI